MIIGFKKLPNRIPKGEHIGITSVCAFTNSLLPRMNEFYVPFGVEFDNTVNIAKFKMIERTITSYYERFFVTFKNIKAVDLRDVKIKENLIPIAVREYANDEHVVYVNTIIFKQGIETVHRWFDAEPTIYQGKFIHDYLLDIAKDDFKNIYSAEEANKLINILNFEYKNKVAQNCSYDNSFELLMPDDEPSIFSPIQLTENMPEFYPTEDILFTNEKIIANSFEEGLLQLCPFKQTFFDNILNKTSAHGYVDNNYLKHHIDYRKYNTSTYLVFNLQNMPDIEKEFSSTKYIEWNYNHVDMDTGNTSMSRLFSFLFEIKLTDIYLKFSCTYNANTNMPPTLIVENNTILFNRYSLQSISETIKSNFLVQIKSYLLDLLSVIGNTYISVELCRYFNDEAYVSFMTTKNEKYIIYYDHVFNMICTRSYTTQGYLSK